MKRRFRFIQRIHAALTGHFWLPCPLCGKHFGGHEESGTLMTHWGYGKLVCVNCRDKAEELNKEFMRNNPLVVNP